MTHKKLLKKTTCIVCIVIMLLSLLTSCKETSHTPISTKPTIAISNDHAAIVKEDGSLWTWGNNTYGQCGNGTRTYGSIPPEKVQSGIISVAAGTFFTLAIDADNTLLGWGSKIWGSLTNRAIEVRDTPDSVYPFVKPMEIMEDVVYVSCKDAVSMAIKKDGTLWRWGSIMIQGGAGTLPGLYNPEPTLIMEDVSSVVQSSVIFHYDETNTGNSFQSAYVLAIKNDNSLWLWGYNLTWQVDETAPRHILDPIKIMDNVTSVAVSNKAIAIIKDDKSLWLWGELETDWLGKSDERNIFPEPKKVLDSVSEVSVNTSHVMAIREDGSLWAMGDNKFSQLGDGTTEARADFVKVMEHVTTVAAGPRHTIACLDDGRVLEWGWTSRNFLSFGEEGVFPYTPPQEVMLQE